MKPIPISGCSMAIVISSSWSFWGLGKRTGSEKCKGIQQKGVGLGPSFERHEKKVLIVENVTNYYSLRGPWTSWNGEREREREMDLVEEKLHGWKPAKNESWIWEDGGEIGIKKSLGWVSHGVENPSGPGKCALEVAPRDVASSQVQWPDCRAAGSVKI